MSGIYTHLLVALDLGPQSLYIAKQCQEIASIFGAQLTCLHVVEPPMTYMTEFARRQKIIEKNIAMAETSLEALCAKLHYPNIDWIVAEGAAQHQILAVAQAQQCDLIMVGSHGVGGYTHLLGSTAQHILTNAPCDVFIIQVAHLEQLLAKQPSQHCQWQEVPEDLPRPLTSSVAHSPPHGGSRKGFGENIRRGPRLVNRPANFPYKGGHKDDDGQS